MNRWWETASETRSRHAGLKRRRSRIDEGREKSILSHPWSVAVGLKPEAAGDNREKEAGGRGIRAQFRGLK